MRSGRGQRRLGAQWCGEALRLQTSSPSGGTKGTGGSTTVLVGCETLSLRLVWPGGDRGGGSSGVQRDQQLAPVSWGQWMVALLSETSGLGRGGRIDPPERSNVGHTPEHEPLDFKHARHAQQTLYITIRPEHAHARDGTRLTILSGNSFAFATTCHNTVTED